MPSKQGDLSLLNDPVAQQLLNSTIPARLAYIWKDGTPRVVPIWFHWNGKEVVLATPPGAPKAKILQDHPKVALTIDSESFPTRVLSIRGTASVEMVNGVPDEYAAAARRYLGEEQGNTWVEQVRTMFSQQTRISIQPEWVGILDFETRFPSAIEAVMSRS